MTHQKGRPTIQKKDRRKGFTITAAPWLQDWLDEQPVSRGEVIEQVVKYFIESQTQVKKQ